MFKEYFKKYKAKNADLSEVYNLKKDHFEKDGKLIGLNAKETEAEFFGLVPTNKWKICEIKEAPGLIVIRNPFTGCGQRYWIARSLSSYTRKPNRTNLDIFKVLKENEEWWETCQLNSDFELLKKLRWSTLGYHHNWDSKEYSESEKTDFPEDLCSLSKYIANVLGYGEYRSEAAIVNFYHMNSTLSGHTDHSENDLEAPLISISFGQTAVFMLGGKTLDEKPIALFLHSGDIVIMSKQSRLCYHGVPKILPADEEPWNKDVVCEHLSEDDVIKQDLVNGCAEENFWRPYQKYIKTARININIRQVLKNGQCVL